MRICANIGLFTTVVAIIPDKRIGRRYKSWQIVVIAIVLITWAFLCFTVFGVKEDRSIKVEQESTSLKEMFRSSLKTTSFYILRFQWHYL